MEEDQNFLKVKIKFLIIILTLLFTSKSYCEKIALEKLVELDSPWGSSFISNNEIIVTEKSGKIKIVDMLYINQITEAFHNRVLLVEVLDLIDLNIKLKWKHRHNILKLWTQ